jgi:hypothetical protein
LEERRLVKEKPMISGLLKGLWFHLIKSQKIRFSTTGPEVQEKATHRTLNLRIALRERKDNTLKSKRKDKRRQWPGWQAVNRTENHRKRKNRWSKIVRSE